MFRFDERNPIGSDVIRGGLVPDLALGFPHILENGTAIALDFVDLFLVELAKGALLDGFFASAAESNLSISCTA